MTPLVVPDNRGTGGSIVFGMQTVLRTLGVFELLHLRYLDARHNTHTHTHTDTHTSVFDQKGRISMKTQFLWTLFEKIRKRKTRYDKRMLQWHGEPRTRNFPQTTVAPSESIIAAPLTRIWSLYYMQWDSMWAHRCVLPVSSCTAAVPASASPHSANRRQQLRQSITKNDHRTSL